jgi:O-antigen/teichoic acid export membrane protein
MNLPTMVGTDSRASVERHDSVAGRIGRGLAANVAGNGVTLLIQLVTVPVLLAAWGVPTYGAWLVLSAIPAYVALSDLSFSSVAGTSMVMFEAAGKRTEAVALGRRLWSIVTVITGAAALAATAIAVVFGATISNGSAIPAPETELVLGALFLQVAVGNQYGILDAWYRTGGRYPLGATMRQIWRLFEFGALLGVVLLGARPGIAAISFLGGSVAGFGISWIVLRKAVPWSTFRPERPHLQTFRELLPPGLAYMALPIGNALSLQGFTVVIGSTLGAAAVVVFSATRTVTRVALQAMGSVNSSVWPELSRSVGAGQIDQARAILRHSVQLALLGSFSLVAVLALLGVPIIRWWTHGLVDPPVLLLFILLVVIVANSAWYTLAAVLAATNRHKRMAVAYLLGTTVAVLAAIPLSAEGGLVGAAVALLAIDVAMVGYVVPAALRVVDDDPASFFRALLDVRGAIHSAISSLRSGA